MSPIESHMGLNVELIPLSNPVGSHSGETPHEFNPMWIDPPMRDRPQVNIQLFIPVEVQAKWTPCEVPCVGLPPCEELTPGEHSTVHPSRGPCQLETP